jgi:hypothetical protein
VRSASITYMIRHYAGRRRSDLVLITRIMPLFGHVRARVSLNLLRHNQIMSDPITKLVPVARPGDPHRRRRLHGQWGWRTTGQVSVRDRKDGLR